MTPLGRQETWESRASSAPRSPACSSAWPTSPGRPSSSTPSTFLRSFVVVLGVRTSGRVEAVTLARCAAGGVFGRCARASGSMARSTRRCSGRWSRRRDDARPRRGQRPLRAAHDPDLAVPTTWLGAVDGAQTLSMIMAAGLVATIATRVRRDHDRRHRPGRDRRVHRLVAGGDERLARRRAAVRHRLVRHAARGGARDDHPDVDGGPRSRSGRIDLPRGHGRRERPVDGPGRDLRRTWSGSGRCSSCPAWSSGSPRSRPGSCSAASMWHARARCPAARTSDGDRPSRRLRAEPVA